MGAELVICTVQLAKRFFELLVARQLLLDEGATRSRLLLE